MNKQEAMERIKNIGTLSIFDKVAGQQVDMVIKNEVLDIISQIDEPVEKEKLYTVEIPNPHNKHYMNVLNRMAGKIIVITLTKPNTTYFKNKEYQLTESEIKQDFDFLWQFAKPVEEDK